MLGLTPVALRAPSVSPTTLLPPQARKGIQTQKHYRKAGAPIILPFDMDYETICQYYIDLQNRAQYSWDAEGAKRAYRTKCAPIWQ